VGSTQFLSARTADLSTGRLPGMPEAVHMSSAAYAASAPFRDAIIQEAVLTGQRPHIFVAVLTSEPNAHGGDHLRRNLHRQLQQELIAEGGNVEKAFRSALFLLERNFKALHIQNSPLLSGTQIAAAYVDLTAGQLYLLSNGGCRAVVASRDGAEQLLVSHELGRPSPEETAAAVESSSVVGSQRKAAARAAAQRGVFTTGGPLGPNSIVSVPITGDVESITLGSSGLWRELPAQQAAVRVSSLAASAPHALGGNSAAALAQLALQNVAVRCSASKDPRMSALRDPATLQQVWTGSKRNYRWGGRQPLRRRRGDVHGDLSAVVLRFDWAGSHVLPRSAVAAKRMCGFAEGAGKLSVPRSASGASIASVASFGSLRTAGKASHWDLVRAHFLEFRPAARAAARARWYAAVSMAQIANTVAKAKAKAAAAAAAAQQEAEAEVSAAAGTADVQEGQLQQSEDIPQLMDAQPAALIDAVAVPSSSSSRLLTPAALGSGAASQEASGSVQRASLKVALSNVAAEIAAEERAARRRSLATVSRRRIDPAGSVHSLTAARAAGGSFKNLSRFVGASKRGLQSLIPQSVH